jgi:alpha-mannosidase
VATRALDAAERLSTFAWLRANRPYPRAELDALWKSLLLARDHNYGGQGAGGGQARKFAERRNVQHRAQVLASQAMAALAECVEAPRESVPVVVFNTLNWDRSDVVHAHVSRYEAASGTKHDIFPRGSAMELRGPDGQPVPFQITADRRGTLGEFDFCFVARDVPALGYASYTLEPATGPAPPRGPQLWFEAGAPEPAVVNKPELTLENGKMRLTIERVTGLARINDVVTGLGLAGRQELPEVCRRPPLGLSVDDPAREKIEPFVPAGSEAVRMLADGPVLTAAAVRGSVLGAPAELRYTLHRDLPWVDVEVRIDWDLRRFGRIELTYQVPLKNARAAYGLPFGAGAFGADQLMPNSGPIGGDEGSRASWERTREISRWLDVSDDARGVAMATSHRWTRVDNNDTGAAVRCCLLRGGRMRPPDPGTNATDLRTGLVFNFRLYPHTGSWQAARIPRVGWEATQPLLAYTVNDTWSQKSLPKRQSLATVAVASGKGDAMLTCLKQAEDGKGVVARWYEATGQPCRVRAALLPADSRVRRSDMMEKPTAGEAADGVIATTAHEIVTVRTEK